MVQTWKNQEKQKQRYKELLDQHAHELAINSDRLYIYFFFFQWLLTLVISAYFSLKCQSGNHKTVAYSIATTVIIGGILSGIPIYFILSKPGRTLNRFVNAISQGLYSIFFFYLTQGSIEAYFYVFASLIFLSFYRNCKLLFTASLITIADHYCRTSFFPHLNYGYFFGSYLKLFEYCILIFLENAFLTFYLRSVVKESNTYCKNQSLFEFLEAQARAASISANQYRYALDSYAIITLTDLDGKITYVNDNFCKLCKFSREEAIGNTYRMINSGHHPKSFFQILWETVSAGKVWHGEVQNKAKDGTLFWVDTTIVPLVDENNKPKEYLTIRRDITLEVQEKINAEKRRQLEEAVITAEKANQAKSAFLANISHELRTPMHGILSFARFGQQKIETATKEKLKSYFDEIYDSASRLMSLLNDLLDLSKLEAGKVVYSMQNRNMVETVKAIQSEMSAFAEEKHLKIEVSTSVPSENCNAQFDHDKIMQVIRNLLSNAIKFSDKETTIKILVEQPREKIIRCSIINKGVGIPELELESVFDKFVQSSKTRTNAGGTGLGLAICKEIIHQHKGKIWAESKLNEETKFIFELPQEDLIQNNNE